MIRTENTGSQLGQLRKGKRRYAKGRRQNTSVENGDFLQKNIKCMLVEFCRPVTPSTHVTVKGHLGDDNHLLLYITILCNVFLLKGGSSHQPSAKS